MIEPRTIFLTGGGTGGHLYPGIAVAEALRDMDPGIKPIFLCTEREIDTTILTPIGYEFIRQPIVPPVRSIGGLLKFWTAWRETGSLAKRIFEQHKPAAVLGLGGYAAGVVVRLAGNRNIPAAILNPDVIPGKANQFLLKYVRAMCGQFEATRDHLSSSNKPKLQITGCPIRRDISSTLDRAGAIKRLGLMPEKMTLVITGASQGAKTVNDAILEALPGLNLQGWQVLHLTGKEHAESVRAGYRQLDLQASIIDFTPAMADVWAVADLTVSRSGASTCAELTSCGVPSILMPYPYHKDRQQTLNAKVLADAEAAVLMDDVKDKKRNGEALTQILQSLLYDAPRRSRMAQSARALGKPEAAKNVARLIMEMIPGSR
jgi:UDP-N-acetylglucosamine--N-acetylmuramyl-(pentapeptide) pyrophosphoryl-undecaprenol N-acetylglucosamine transferase